MSSSVSSSAEMCIRDRRKKSYVLYVKEGAQIVDMLAIMEANVALMDLENIRIQMCIRDRIIINTVRLIGLQLYRKYAQLFSLLLLIFF